MDKKIEMTDEIKEQLVGLLPMSKNSVLRFTPNILKDIPEDFRPVFVIRQLSNKQIKEVRGIILAKKPKSAKAKEEATARDEEIYTEIMLDCLDTWYNLYDVGTGELIEYSKEAAVELPEHLKVSLITKMMNMSGLFL